MIPILTAMGVSICTALGAPDDLDACRMAFFRGAAPGDRMVTGCPFENPCMRDIGHQAGYACDIVAVQAIRGFTYSQGGVVLFCQRRAES